MEFNPAQLYPYQIPAATHLIDVLREQNAALDGSDMGTGKTAVACSIIRHFNRPTLVLAPQISLTAWRRMGELFHTEFDVLNPEIVRTGNTPFGTWEKPKPKGRLETEFFCNRCQLQVDPAKPRPCPYHRAGIHCVITKKVQHDYGKFFWHPAVKFLVFDEVHRFSAVDSLNAEMLIAAKRQGITTLALSATAASSPLGLRALGYVLGLHDLVGLDNGFYRFIFRNGCKKAPFGGFFFGSSEEDRRARMAKLHVEIFPSRGSRIKIADLGGAFPACSIRAELFELNRPERIDALYQKMNEAIEELRDIRAGDVNLDHPLTKILRARQELELLKVPLFQELAEQELEAGNSVAFFMAFRATIDELCSRLRIKARIVGGQKPAEREAAIDDFQSDRERIIAANVDAGGVSVSLHDVRGEFPRVGLVSPVFSSVKIRQVFGRLSRIGGKSKCRYRVVLAAGTCEEKIHKAVSAKLNNLDALNDFDLMAANLPLQRAEWPESL